MALRKTFEDLRALGYVTAPAGCVPSEGESLFRSKVPDYVVDDNGCWVWQKSKLAGYGMSGLGRAHRVYWERANGPIPEGWDVHHLCKVPPCVNPAHLEAIGARAHDHHHFLNEKGLSLEDVVEIRRLGKIPGVSYKDVAERFGISANAVYLHWNGERWADEVGGAVEPEPWACARADCENPVSGIRHKRYCSPRCKSLAGAARRRAGIYSPGGSNGRFFDTTTPLPSTREST